MAALKISDIAGGNLKQNLNQQALNQFVGPVKGTTDTSLTGQTAQAALAALQKSQQQSAIPNPTKSMGGGVMAQNANGINAGGGNVMAKTQPIPSSDGMNGIRASFNNAGIDNDAIGYDGQNVTVNGRAYITPQTVQDGTSYSREQDINKAINNIYRDNNKQLVGANDYVSAQGMKSAVTWSDGQLMIGGQQVPIAYVDSDGTAYAQQSDVDNAIAAYRESAGITGNREVYDNWNDKYGRDIRSALKDITDRDEWSYTPEEDAAYRAYRDAYIREGNRAYEDAYAKAAATTGGYGSSSAMTAAGQQMNYYLQQLNDRVPELMANDYDRYLNEQNLRQKALDAVMSVGDSDYSKEYQANRDAINDTNEANYQNWIRNTDARDYNRRVYENDRDYDRSVEVEDRQWEYQEPLLQNQVKQSNIDTDYYERNAAADLAAKELSNWQAQAQNILTKYSYGNIDMPISAVDAEAIGIPMKEDGTYPSIREMQQSYGSIQAMLEALMWEKAGRQETLDTWQINNGVYGM